MLEERSLHPRTKKSQEGASSVEAGQKGKEREEG